MHHTGDAKCPQVLLRRRFAVQRFVRRLGGSRHSLPSRLTPASEILTAPRGLPHRMTAISVLAVQPLSAGSRSRLLGRTLLSQQFLEI
jgi:hypothetical protein